ncbi:transmembrane protein [Jingmen Myotis davidii paramyxovirus 1]|uniref:Transmembrane protein n=1 Tax=Jingmen Myotis davidii paramyxovirus 1 TaxID=2928983 RepID=A0A8T9KMK3_9MONO|nr:transmembrane protein [Jingmen Myotis davidii paramyxovirus 1]
MDYYRAPTENNQQDFHPSIYSKKERIDMIKSIIKIIIVICMMTSSCIVLYNTVFIKDNMPEESNHVKQILAIIKELRETVIYELRPRISVIDRAITYQLPHSIMKAFEISHTDLRSALSQIIMDLEKIVDIHRSMLGIYGDEFHDENVPYTQISEESDDGNTTASPPKEETLMFLKKINETISFFDQRNYDFTDVTMSIKSAFKGFIDYVKYRSKNNSTYIQFDSYIRNVSRYNKIAARYITMSDIITNLGNNIDLIIKDCNVSNSNYTNHYFRDNKYREIVRNFLNLTKIINSRVNSKKYRISKRSIIPFSRPFKLPGSDHHSKSRNKISHNLESTKDTSDKEDIQCNIKNGKNKDIEDYHNRELCKRCNHDYLIMEHCLILE